MEGSFENNVKEAGSLAVIPEKEKISNEVVSAELNCVVDNIYDKSNAIVLRPPAILSLEPKVSEVTTENSNGSNVTSEISSKAFYSTRKQSQNPVKVDVVEIDDAEEPPADTALPEDKVDKSVLLEFEGGSGTVKLLFSDAGLITRKDFLNDAVVDFWLEHYLKEYVKDRNNILLMSSLFYTSWISRKQDSSSIRGRSWTRGISDFFLKEFIFVPIVVEGHWILVIIVQPGLVYYKQFRKKNTNGLLKDYESAFEARLNNGKRSLFLMFDSMKDYGLNYTLIAENLRNFLNATWKEKYGSAQIDCTFTSSNLPTRVPNVPQQANYHDCGVFVCQYFEAFFDNPITSYTDEKLNSHLQSWFSLERVKLKRRYMIEEMLKICRADTNVSTRKIEFLERLVNGMAVQVLPTKRKDDGSAKKRIVKKSRLSIKAELADPRISKLLRINLRRCDEVLNTKKKPR